MHASEDTRLDLLYTLHCNKLYTLNCNTCYTHPVPTFIDGNWSKFHTVHQNKTSVLVPMSSVPNSRARTVCTFPEQEHHVYHCKHPLYSHPWVMTDHGLQGSVLGSFQNDPSERAFASQSRVCHGAKTITVSPSQSDLMSLPSRFTTGWIERDTHARSMHARFHGHMHTHAHTAHQNKGTKKYNKWV